MRITPLWGKIFFPALSQIKEEEELRKFYFKAFKYSFMVRIPVYVIIMALSKEIVRSLYGAKWSPSVIPMQVLALVAFFKFTQEPVVNSLFIAKGKIEKLLKITLLSALLNIIAVFCGISFGINGVAISLLFFDTLWYGIS